MTGEAQTPPTHRISEVLRTGGRWARSVLARVGSHELALLAGVAVVFAAGWAFIELTDEVLGGDTETVDEALIRWFRNPSDLADPIGPGWLEEMARDFTALGGAAVLGFMTLAVCGFLFLHRKARAALFVAVAVSSGLAASTALKALFGRPRPSLVPHESIVFTASFPSGHSTMAALTYLTLAALLARSHHRFTIRAYLLCLGVLLTVLVGISRVYVGVHWPSDVLAGWTLGAGWAAMAWVLARALQRRGRIEKAE